MKNYDYWKMFIRTGRVDDYLHYVACTKEENYDEFLQETSGSIGCMEVNKEGGVFAGIDYRDGNGSVSHAGW